MQIAAAPTYRCVRLRTPKTFFAMEISVSDLNGRGDGKDVGGFPVISVPVEIGGFKRLVGCCTAA